MSLNQKGFSAVEALLLTAIVAIISGTGFYVYNANKKADDNYSNAAKSAQSSPEKITKKKPSVEKPAATTQQYMTVKEWGVRLAMPETVDAADLYYVIDTSSFASSAIAWIGSNKVKAVSTACDPTNSTGASPFGGIERLTATEYEKGLQNSQDTGITTGSGTKLGDYFYVWQSNRANCNGGTGDAAVETVKATVNFPKQEMPTLLKSIEAIPKS